MKYKLEWIYKLKGGEGVLVTSDWLDGETALLFGEEIERSGKGKELTFYDEAGTSWILKEMKKLLIEVEEEPHDILVFFDGGYNKDTNESGLGAVIYYKQGKKKYRIRSNQLFHELENNNEAEYAALHYALSLLEELGVSQMSCEFKGDAQGVLKQLEGDWPCYEENLSRWLDNIEEKINGLSLHARYTPISRNENKEADKLASQALEGKVIHSKMQLL
ncbi:reverse transcriptase-like protein [Cytobacillus purgationiresistens]|uniref:Ribonuclease HI n=1 Tax=Cytobacillus purgationiresistens TaxID=863449 RepID=A0ABU0AME0_9BACI|nr:reverse transcriptase-like protein [Cytobacillus purgationiresistens]MDQ0272044.1 ribonuclease HI [Cytobacillus purgationiresistens]